MASGRSRSGPPGQREVTNPLYGGAGSTQPKTIVRDYGFGAAGGFVTLGGTRIAYSSWTDGTIVAVVPAMPPALPAPSVAQMAASHTGELAVERCLGGKTGATSTTGSCNDGRKSVLGITLTVATSQMHAARAPVVVSPGQKIQAAINAAKPGDLLLVQPGTYEEMLVMTKPVRLQGVGSSSTIINVVTAPSENVQAWLDYVGPLLSANSGYLLPGQPAFATTGSQGLAQPGDVAAVLGDEGAAVTVLGKNLVSLLGICPFAFNNAPATESAYCLHDENYPNLLRPWLRPNARIDGFTITGANSAPGVMLNGYNRYLEVSNNRIHTNAGTNAGGILLGHVGQQDLGDVNAHNEFVSIHNNLVTQNAGLESTGGGGVVIGAGSANYRVYENFVVANFAAGQGAGVSHIGSVATSLFGPNADPDAAFLMPTFWGSTTDVPSSDRNVGVIDRNTIVFNESFSQGVTTTGGGVFVGGTPPAAGAPQLGSGNVRISNNLIQGNAASGGDGGGVSLLGTAGQSNYVVGLYNNIIANNVAAFAGGGVVLRDAGRAELVHDTIVNNDSLGTAGDAFIGPTQSAPSVSGVFVRNTLGGSSDPNRPKITNTIIWHNRSFRFGPTSGGFQVPGAPTTYGLIACTSSPCTADGFWDLGASGGTLQTFGTTTSTGGTAPSFVAQYVNGDRHSAYQTDAGTTILVPAALDEGGNFIRPQFGPLSLTRANDTRFANYHLSAPDPGISLSSSTGSGGYGTGTGAVPAALLFDIDAQPRPTATPHRGADQVTGFVPQPTALDDAATTTGGPVTITVLTNDNLATPAAGKPLLVTGIANLVGGSATTDGTTVIYTPQAGFNGLGSLTYTVSGPGGEASAVVRINVGASAPQLSVSPSALNFGDLNRGSVSAPQTVTVSNLGNAALTGLAVSLAGGDAGEFALPPPPGCGSTLAVGASCNVSVTFGPTSATLGAKEATLNVTESGGSTASVSLVGTSLGTGLTIASAPLAFGFQTINQASPTQTVQIVNNGNDIAYFTWTAGGANLNQFIISDGCPTVPATPPDPRRYVVPGGVCGIDVAFRPTSGGLKSASLSITPTGGAAVPVSITGTGVAVGLTRLPAALSFGSVPVGASSASQAVTVTNTGAAPVQIALSFSGSSASQFSQTGSCPVAPAAIAAGANCVANVVFTPTGNGGNRNATLTVTPLGNTALSLTVGLSGTATAPNLALACPSGCFSANSTYSFGPVNGSLSRTFTLSNAGATAVAFTIGSITAAKTTGGNGSYSVAGGTCAVGGTLGSARRARS